MKRHRNTSEQAMRKLHEGGRMLNEGSDLTDVLKQLEIEYTRLKKWSSPCWPYSNRVRPTGGTPLRRSGRLRCFDRCPPFH